MTPNVRRSFRRRLFVGALLALLVAAPSRLAQANRAELVAGFLFRLTTMTLWENESEWPETLCFAVVGDEEVAQLLSETMRVRKFHGHDVEVHSLVTAVGATACPVVFVGEEQVSETLAMLVSASSLTVSLAENFVKNGGMIEFVPKVGKLRFRINRTAMTEHGITISSKVLRLAISVR